VRRSRVSFVEVLEGSDTPMSEQDDEQDDDEDESSKPDGHVRNLLSGVGAPGRRCDVTGDTLERPVDTSLDRVIRW
jgi:hypothetical protein